MILNYSPIIISRSILSHISFSVNFMGLVTPSFGAQMFMIIMSTGELFCSSASLLAGFVLMSALSDVKTANTAYS